MSYTPAVKRITTPVELQAFHTSPAYTSLMGFIKRLGEAAQGKGNSTSCHVSEAVTKIIGVLDELRTTWIQEIPPIPHPMRYGNKAARIWHQRLADNITQLHDRILPEELRGAAVELGPYLMDSFGNSTRLDYGTGHELHFVAWVYCLRALGVVRAEDEPALVLKVFPSYLDLARTLQKVYGLEPAGSHGVWSLDDYQFIPFIWGASQLIDNAEIKPVDSIKQPVVEKYGDEYLYLGCIKFIYSVKKGPFHEHSPDLYSISGAASWNKIYAGMQRKFHDDVFGKVPVMQHFLFGSILPFPK